VGQVCDLPFPGPNEFRHRAVTGQVMMDLRLWWGGSWVVQGDPRDPLVALRSLLLDEGT
jgi:hypothetical protein